MANAALLVCAPPGNDRRWSPDDRLDETTRVRDATLVGAIRAESPEQARQAFDTLFRAYVEPLIRFAHAYTNDLDGARELVADVFLGVWQSRTTWTPAHGAAVYLYGSVRNRAHNLLRARRRQRHWTAVLTRDDDPPGRGSYGERADQMLEREETARRVWNAIDALPEFRRQAVVLRWHHGMTVPEIAAVLDTSPAAVYQLLKRSYDVLRTLLGPALI